MWKKALGAGVGFAVGYSLYQDIKQEMKETSERATLMMCGDNWSRLHEKHPDKYNKHVFVGSIKDKKPTFADSFDEDFVKHIDFEIASKFSNNLRKISSEIDKNKEISKDDKTDLVVFVESVGGEVGAVKMICDTIDTFKQKHNSTVYVVVDNYAFSGGSIIALTADEVMMSDFAKLSRIDPQMVIFPMRHISDETMKDTGIEGIIGKMATGIAKDSMGTVLDVCESYIQPKYTEEEYNKIMDTFLHSDKLHVHTFNKTQCKKSGLNVSDIPKEVVTPAQIDRLGFHDLIEKEDD